MSKITGLGGAFFNVNGEQDNLLKWYSEILGLEVTEYGINIDSDQQTLITLKSPNNNAYVNFTVDNIEEFMKNLKEKNVEVVSEISTYDYGKFSQIKDLFGNIIELFEINTLNYKKMVLKELETYQLKHTKKYHK